MEDNLLKEQLRSYNDKIHADLDEGVAINEIERNLSDLVSNFTDELKKLGVIADRRIVEDRTEEITIYSEKIQQEIARLQIEKTLILRQLREDIHKLDDEVEIENSPNSYRVSYKEEQNPFYIKYNNKEYRLTWGMIKSGILWGLEYSLDKSTPKSFRKKYLIERAKNKINTLYQIQIAKHRKLIKDDNPLGKAHISYHNLANILSERNTDDLDQGHKSEKIAECLLVRYAEDHPSYFTIDPTSVISDVQFKSDFILRRASNLPSDQSVYNSIGIQWYSPENNKRGLRNRQFKLLKTKKKLAGTDFKKSGIDAIKFITSPFDINKIYDLWVSEKPPFSPDIYIEKQIQIQILVQCLSEILTPIEISEMLDIGVEDVQSANQDQKMELAGDLINPEEAIVTILKSGDKARIEKGLKNDFFCQYVLDHLQETRDFNQDFIYTKLVEFGYGQILLTNIVNSKVDCNKDNLIKAFDSIGKIEILRLFYSDLGISTNDEIRVTLQAKWG